MSTKGSMTPLMTWDQNITAMREILGMRMTPAPTMIKMV